MHDETTRGWIKGYKCWLSILHFRRTKTLGITKSEKFKNGANKYVLKLRKFVNENMNACINLLRHMTLSTLCSIAVANICKCRVFEQKNFCFSWFYRRRRNSLRKQFMGNASLIIKNVFSMPLRHFYTLSTEGNVVNEKQNVNVSPSYD